MRPVYVLGTGLSHDGSACLLKDGRIAVAIEKERITRRKHDGGNDNEAIRYCLTAEGIELADVELVVQNENFGMFHAGNDWYGGAPRLLADHPRVVTISHHLAHACSAYYASPFEEAATLVIDGCGNNLCDVMDPGMPEIPVDPPEEVRHLYHEKDSYYSFDSSGCRALFKDFSPWGFRLRGAPVLPPTTMHSIGGLYSGVSAYVFGGMDDPGRLMGLAPYGIPGVFDFEMFDLRDGRAFVRYDWMSRFDRPARSPQAMKANFQYYANLAWNTQREVERALLYVINARHDLFPADNLAYSGGVALNAVANRRIAKESKFKHVFFQPAAGDNGLAIGCAYYGWNIVLGRERVRASGSSALGVSYPRARIASALARVEGLVGFEETPQYIRRTAEVLAAGKTVGWYQGGSEFGPRALGHRSILADPRRAEMRDHINSKIKLREDFRPFAPSVLAADAPIYFDCDYESPYMLLVAPTRTEWRDRIPSVVHADGSARIQTVTSESDPVYHALLDEFKRVAGISVLLNTSFNRKGMPIVETPEDAIDFFLTSALDILVLGDTIVTKKAEVGGA